MAEEKKIYKAISAVMQDVGYVGKDSTNPQQKYKYRGIDAVMNALQPAMIKNGIFVVPSVISKEREERVTKTGGFLIYSVLTIKYTFYAEDGSSVEAIIIGEGMDSGDKATNKALSVGFKYACFQVFCIPTEEFIDSEVDSPEPEPKTIDELVGEITQLRLEKNIPLDEILNRAKAKSLDKCERPQLESIIRSLKKSAVRK